jgi:DNA-directed RNA polymerase specialized sigma24 family protein
MHSAHRHSPIDSNDYVVQFRGELSTQLTKRPLRDADDIVQGEVVDLLEDVESVAARYPDPKCYARVRANAAIANHFRKEKRQRGEGSRSRMGDDGKVVGGRTVVSGHAPVPGSEGELALFDTLASLVPDPIDEWVSNHSDRELLGRCLIGVNSETANILAWAYVLDHTDSEIAAVLHCARETVNRKKQNGVRQIRGRLGPHAA